MLIKRNQIEKITILLRTETQRDILIKKISNLPVDEDHPVQVVISEEVKKRGVSQNSYYWMRLGEIATQAWSNGRQYDSDVWHEYGKKHIMPDIVEIKSGEKVSKFIDSPDGNQIIVSTTQLSKKQFSEYTEMIEAFGASLGVMFSANPRES